MTSQPRAPPFNFGIFNLINQFRLQLIRVQNPAGPSAASRPMQQQQQQQQQSTVAASSQPSSSSSPSMSTSRSDSISSSSPTAPIGIPLTTGHRRGSAGGSGGGGGLWIGGMMRDGELKYFPVQFRKSQSNDQLSLNGSSL